MIMMLIISMPIIPGDWYSVLEIEVTRLSMQISKKQFIELLSIYITQSNGHNKSVIAFACGV